MYMATKKRAYKNIKIGFQNSADLNIYTYINVFVAKVININENDGKKI